MKYIKITMQCPSKSKLTELYNTHLQPYDPRFFLYWGNNGVSSMLLYITFKAEDDFDDSLLTYISFAFTVLPPPFITDRPPISLFQMRSFKRILHQIPV